MKVQLVADEFFAWNFYGGYGAFTRKLGCELVKHGVEVEAIVQKISSLQKPVGESEIIDGVTVTTLPRGKLDKLSSILYSTDADIIHSQCGRFDTYLAFKNNPETIRIATIQDLRTKQEYALIQRHYEPKKFVKRQWAKIVDRYYKKALQNCDAVAIQAKLLAAKANEAFNIKKFHYLPNFIDIPKGKITKSPNPSIVFLGRLDPIKDPELTLKTATKLPDVDFYILGKARNPLRDKQLRVRYGHFKNIHFLGHQSGKIKDDILSKCWILINTSAYECFPVSFLEAAAHQCAIIATQNPDEFTEKFGHYTAYHGEYLHLNLAVDIQFLLKNDAWRDLGKKAYDYVCQNHSTEVGVQNHLNLYRRLLHN